MTGQRLGPRNATRHGFATAAGREEKARKILKILAESQALARAPGLVLDIGTGSGGIAAALAEQHRVISVDVVDQRVTTEGYSFLLAGDSLPFRDGVFDVVVSNHVIEHVPDQERHLEEIARVLRPGGVCYLATPNRIWPREPHHRVWLIHWLPPRWFAAILRRCGAFREQVRLLTWGKLLRHARRSRFAAEIASDRVLRHPRRYFMQVPPLVAGLLAALPAAAYRSLVFLHPTFIVLLRKGPSGGKGRPPQA
jgi:SAM-dependent methyltransferase